MGKERDIVYRSMSAVKSKDTKPEKKLGTEMWSLGLRYRKQYKIFGKPDFVFMKKRIVLFCDGDFWHGNNWRIRGLSSLEQELNSYSDYWQRKIKRNIERDKEVNKKLKEQGWTVLRYWASDIEKRSESIATEIYKLVKG